MPSLAKQAYKALKGGKGKPLSPAELAESKEMIKKTARQDSELLKLKERYPRLHRFVFRESDAAVGVTASTRYLLQKADELGEDAVLEQLKGVSKRMHERELKRGAK